MNILDASTIRTSIARLPGTTEQLTRLFELATWAIELPQEKLLHLSETGTEPPRWKEDLFPGEVLNKAREQFEKGDRLAFRVPVTVVQKSSAGGVVRHRTFFDVFLERDNRMVRGEDYYIRQGITIHGIRMLGDKPVRGLVIVNNSALSTLLGDAETPAHTNWEERSRKVAERYHYGASTVRFVKTALRELVALLSRPAEGLDEDLLRDLFYIDLPDQEGPERTDKKKQRGQKQPEPSPESPDPEEGLLQIQRLADGFRVSRNPEATTRPATIRVQVAYEVRRGNPFKRYHPLDFELNKAPIRIEVKGAKITFINGNVLEAAVDTYDFELAVRGFDRKRDIKVRVDAGGDEP